MYKFYTENNKRVLSFEVEVSPEKAWQAMLDTDQFSKLFLTGKGNGKRTQGECEKLGAKYSFTH
eukprot:snap_masked-scaffold_26-processed-gene-1.27-mRNA-1 protein AED:1.00 eAED:1.00 QI:0/-1/0/0/-1/1/1/0/63